MIRLRFKDFNSGSQKTISFSQEETLENLLNQIKNEFLIKADFKLKNSLTQAIVPNEQLEKSLKDLNIRSGDSFAIEYKVVRSVKEDRSFVKRPIPDDNSCLFNSIGYVLLNKDIKSPDALRLIIAQAVQENPSYDEVFLGMSRSAYIEKITQINTWGGAIELSIFSKYFQVEIVAIDVESGNAYRFGENENYTQRVFLLYSGIHYDAIVYGIPIDTSANTVLNMDFKILERDTTVFETMDDDAFVGASGVAEKELKLGNFVNLQKFKLKCADCGAGFVGEQEAQDHAQSSGHLNFREY